MVGVLTAGLLAAGTGTMAFLRSTLVQTLNESLVQQAAGDIASRVFEPTGVAGTIAFEPRDDVADTGSIVVVYGAQGERKAVYDGTPDDVTPAIPEAWALDLTVQKMGEIFELSDTKTGAMFHGAVGVYDDVDGAAEYYTQMVIQPLAPTDRVVATYVGIYSILAVLIIVASALLTRGLVTLTFRGLGQVESTAMSIAAGDFGQRMADVVPGTEVGRLKAAINAMLGRVDAALRQRDATVRQMRRFIGDASHELRTPLVTVRGYAELYRMGAIRSDEDIAQSMERIEKEAIRMGVLVEDLLALARLDERRDVELTPIDLRPLARDAALDLRAASPNREVVVDDTTAPAPAAALEPRRPPTGLAGAAGSAPSAGSVAPEPPADPRPAAEAARRRTSSATSAIAIAGATISRLRRRPRTGEASEAAGARREVGDAAGGAEPIAPIVLGEENRIRQVIANLLGNARRFTTDDSPIGLRVGSDAHSGMGWIEVVDHGEGIPEQIREQIFQRFWRADNSRTRETGGSGLGLSIVASIVDALQGTVSVTDTPGGGATFRVSLPLAPSQTDADALPDTQPIARLG